MTPDGLAGHEVEVEGLAHERCELVDATVEAELVGVLHDFDEAVMEGLHGGNGRIRGRRGGLDRFAAGVDRGDILRARGFPLGLYGRRDQEEYRRQASDRGRPRNRNRVHRLRHVESTLFALSAAATAIDR